MTPKGLLLFWMETSVSYLNLPRKLPANCNVRTAVRHALEWHQGVTFYLNNDCNKRSIEILKLLNIDAIYLSVKIE
jgi:hypothetical protein